MNKKAFGQRLRFLRKLEHLTQARLAEAVDITVEHLSNLERGASSPSFELIIKLAHALETTPANLFLFTSFQLLDEEETPDQALVDVLDWRGYVTRIGSFERDMVTGRSLWSDSLLEIFSLSSAIQDRNLDLILKYMLEDDRASFLDFYQRLTEGKKAPPCTFRFRRKDGLVRLGLAQAEVERDENGHPLKIFGLVMDITEQKRMEQSLMATHQKMEQRVRDRTRELQNTVRRLETAATERKRAENTASTLSQRLHHILNSITDGYFDHDISTDTAFYSPSWGTMLGYEPEELGRKGITWRELVHPDDLARIVESFRQDESRERPSGRLEHEFRLQAKDGSWRWIISRGQVVERDDKGRAARLVGVHTDVTELKAAMAALEKSEARLRQAQKLAQVGSWEMDSPTGRLWWSDNTYCLFGYEPGEEMTTMEFFLNHIHPEDVRRVLNEHARVRRDKDQYEVEFRFTRKDGEERYGLSMADPVCDDEGHLLRLSGAFQDVTDLKRAEFLVRRSEERYRLLAEHSADMVWVTDPDLNFIYHSPSCETICGYTSEEMLTLPLGARLTPESMNLVLETIRQRLTGGPDKGVDRDIYTYELEMYHKDGRLIRIEVHTAPMFDEAGRFLGVAGVSRDPTEKRRIEQELRASTKRFQLLFLHAPMGMTRVTLDGTLLEVNHAFARMLGYEKDELKGMPTTNISHPEDMAKSKALRKKILEKGKDGFEVDKRYMHKDGSVIHTRLYVRVLRDLDGKPSHLMGMIIPNKQAGED